MLPFFREINSIITKDKCKTLVKLAKKSEYEPYINNYGDKTRFEHYKFSDTNLADELYNSIKDNFPKSYNGFEITGFDDQFEFIKYEEGVSFDNELSERFKRDDSNLENVLCTYIFLNNDFYGGQIDILAMDRKTTLRSFEPGIGKAIILDCDQYYRNNKVRDGTKYILKTHLQISEKIIEEINPQLIYKLMNQNYK
jgi:hypothetical protein